MRPGDQPPCAARREPTNTTRPQRRRIIPGRNARAAWIGPNTLTAITRSKFASQLGSSQLSSHGQTAALRTRASTSPISPARRSIAARALTSATKAAALRPFRGFVRRHCPRRECRQEAPRRRASRRPSPSLLRCRRRRRLSGCVVQSNRKRFSLSSLRRCGRIPSIAIALRKTREADGENEHRAVEEIFHEEWRPKLG